MSTSDPKFPSGAVSFIEKSFERTGPERELTEVTTAFGIVPLVQSDRGEGVELLARVASGSSSALATLYDAHAERVYAFARRLVGDDAAAEDLVHDVFMALPSAASRYRGDASVRTFLLSIAHNCSRHHIRAAARRRAAIARFEEEPHAATSPPDREAERKQLALRLQCALDALPDEQRVAFVLCEVEELTSVEAAEIVGAPEGTVRTRLFHAKKKLREMLEETR
jgi:RNA polymerase sigma-70 factor (ECF subfamily)